MLELINFCTTGSNNMVCRGYMTLPYTGSPVLLAIGARNGGKPHRPSARWFHRIFARADVKMETSIALFSLRYWMEMD